MVMHMSMKAERINLNEIPLGSDYSGYVWLSDQPEPVVYYPGKILTGWLPEDDNPFIIEGRLFNEKEDVSYAINFYDGEYYVFRYSMCGTQLEFDEKEYLPNRMKDVEYLIYRHFWLEQNDGLCAGMNVLVPFVTVFYGLKLKEE